MGKKLFHRGPSRQELLDAIRVQQGQIEYLGQVLREQIQILRQNIYENVKEELDELNKSLDARIWQSEEGTGKRFEELSRSLDARIWQSEEGTGKRFEELSKSLDARIWRSEEETGKRLEELNKSIDSRIWQSEDSMRERFEVLNKCFDARVWQSEVEIGKRFEELSKSLDARIWQAEEGVGKRLDDRMRWVEKNKLDAGFWNLHYEISKKDSTERQSSSIIYDELFYWENRYNSVLSARIILGFILERLECKSLIDFGCGTGTWLWAASNYGVKDIWGIDGDYVPRNMLMIPESCFQAADLSKRVTVCRNYDMAMSLEVAEHLPEMSADNFVSSICESSDIVLFSAARPGQGGEGHINLQPMTYWIEKFSKHNFKPIAIKQYFADNDKVECWYRENVIMFIMSDRVKEIRDKICSGP